MLTLNAWSMRFPELRSAILMIASDDAMTAPVPELLERIGYKAKPLMNDSQLFVTGFRTTANHRFTPGITGGVIGFGGLGNNRFEGRSLREDVIRDSVRRGHPALADLPLVESWYGPIDRTRSGLPLFGPLPGAPSVFYGYGFSGNGVATTPIAGKILASLGSGAERRMVELRAGAAARALAAAGAGPLYRRPSGARRHRSARIASPMPVASRGC